MLKILMNNKLKVIFFLFLVIIACIVVHNKVMQIEKTSSFEGVIRINQVGYPNSSTKIAYAITNSNLKGKFYITQNGKKIYSNNIGKDMGALNDTYAHVYSLDFSEFDKTGSEYSISIDSVKSPEFKIKDDVYDSLLPLVTDWFEYQKCGVKTNKHEVCHTNDEVTGGWHDAGDYIKFTNTTSRTSIAMAYGFIQNPDAFKDYGAENFRNQVKVGLDFINNMWDNKKQKLYYQVANEYDHRLDWRLPENDKNPKRQAYECAKGQGGDVAGKATAALALGYAMYEDVDQPLANEYLTSAKQIYEWGKVRTIPHVDEADAPDSFYTESQEELYSDLALGAIELYRATDDLNYLKDAKKFVNMAEDGIWKSFAIYELGKLDSSYTKRAISYLHDNVNDFYDTVNSTQFKTSESVANWTHMADLLADAIITQLYKDLSGDDKYDMIATNQINYILGCNPWGYSFIQGAGSKYSKILHHNASIVNKDSLPGTVMQGPCDYKTLKEEGLLKKLGPFDTESYAFGDSPKNYCCCEPTIYSNGYAIWLFSYKKNKP